jgi:hypothetical protein
LIDAVTCGDPNDRRCLGIVACFRRVLGIVRSELRGLVVATVDHIGTAIQADCDLFEVRWLLGERSSKSSIDAPPGGAGIIISQAPCRSRQNPRAGVVCLAADSVGPPAQRANISARLTSWIAWVTWMPRGQDSVQWNVVGGRAADLVEDVNHWRHLVAAGRR